MRVEELALAAEVSVDTVRYYQGRGLLTPPSRRGRIALYGQEHVERLERIRQLQGQGLSLAAIGRLLSGELDPPPARLTAARTFDGERLRLDVLWDPAIGAAFEKLPGGEARGRTLPVDPWVVSALDEFIAFARRSAAPA